jgi:hypothetical protein
MPATVLHPEQRPGLVVFSDAVMSRGSWWTRVRFNVVGSTLTPPR